ncbi:MAG: hypothetical protein IT191_01195 [Microbacteriaceae bacterium]|nr:hypothetical protein [Cryobacterium sp.]MCC6375613.1 hypothetical protein [Microbacteriaceae bacterium]
MKRSKLLAIATLIGVAITLGTGGLAFAYEDSGIGSHACGSQYGLLKVVQQGSGNSWAPGDWSGSPQWNTYTSYFRTIYDYESSGYGGGYWRLTTNGQYSSITPKCTPNG